MASEQAAKILKAHETLVSMDFEVFDIVRGYSGRALKVDVSKNEIEILPVDQQMKELWTGGKGFDLWLTLQEINAQTRWDSTENPICFSSGPLAGTTSFPGSGKTLVTAISPLTDSIMDCNVGGYFGPYLKFAGFDAMEIIGKAKEEIIVFIDSRKGKVTIETAPLESVDSHLLAEELTEMYAEDDDDKRNIGVVSAGRGADHGRMGILNFSFYDWRRAAVRFKQAARGGIGTVFRNKKIKALVIKSRELYHPWTVAPNKVAKLFESDKIEAAAARTDREAIRRIANKWRNDPEYVIEMLQDVQELEHCVSMTAVDEIARQTGASRAGLYHIATFYKAFSLVPRGETEIQVCVGTTCHVKGAMRIVEAFERELDVPLGQTTEDGKFSVETVACLGCCSLAPAVKFGAEILSNLMAKDVAGLIKHNRSASNGNASNHN